MRLLIFSDLHLDRQPYWRIPETFPAYDVALIAGDVDRSPRASVETLTMAKGLADRPIVFVCGNHEFYGQDIDGALADGRCAAEGTKIHLLDRGSVVIDGIRFLGVTLWTDYALYGEIDRALSACSRRIRDHSRIQVRTATGTTLFQPSHALQRHQTDVSYLDAALSTYFGGPTVVLSHHAPSQKSIDARYGCNPINPGFASDLSNLILRHGPVLWCHGHVHDSFDYRVGSTRVFCNPKGYGPRSPQGGSPENKFFNEWMIIDL